MSNILTINDLTKHYGRITAVDHLNLEVPAGVIMGILGPNGSGKTTTLGMVLGVTRPSSGDFTWFGSPNDDHQRRRIGSLLETPNFFPFLNAIDNLKIVAHLRQVDHPDFDQALKTVNLYERRMDAFRTYSLGMKQRLAIAASLLGDPEVLILDEPTNGLDPRGIAEVRNTIRTIGQNGKTILMASHILDEVRENLYACGHLTKRKTVSLRSGGCYHQYGPNCRVGCARSTNPPCLGSYPAGARKMGTR